MPDNDCPVNGVKCVSLARVEALERAVEAEKEKNSRSRERIYDRMGDLERDVSKIFAQYDSIVDRLSSISADLSALKDKPNKRWETLIAALITGVAAFLLARIGL